MKYILIVIALFFISSCSQNDQQLMDCLDEQSSFDSGFFTELEKFESFLIENSSLSEISPESYKVLIEKIEKDKFNVDFELYCQSNDGDSCWLLSLPATTAAYIICPILIDKNPLTVSSQWAKEHGDIGPAYLNLVLTGIVPDYFDKILYRGALIQVIAVIADQNQELFHETE